MSPRYTSSSYDAGIFTIGWARSGSVDTTSSRKIGPARFTVRLHFAPSNR